VYGLLQRVCGLCVHPAPDKLYASPPRPFSRKRPLTTSPGAATYLVQSGDNCGTIVSQYNNFTAHDLLGWNPEIGKECFGLQAYVPVCIGVPGYSYPGPVKGGDIWTPSEIPVPVMPGIVANCSKFEYTDATGVPTLAKILADNGISKQQWNSWNVPTQDPEADWAVWAQYFSCVKA
jgi:hypothetical protein